MALPRSPLQGFNEEAIVKEADEAVDVDERVTVDDDPADRLAHRPTGTPTGTR